MDEKLYGLIAIGSVVELGKGGAKIRNNSGVIEARNAANDAMAVLRVANIGSADNDLVNKGSLSTALTNALATTLIYKGPFDASDESYDAITDPKKGDLYKISVGGTIDGVVWAVGDSLIINNTLTGHPVTADVDKVDSTEAPDILRTSNVSADGDFAEDPTLLATRGTIAGYVADEIAAIPGPTPYSPTRYVALTYASAMSVNIGAVVPDGAKIKSAVVKVTTPFNGTAPTLKLGVTGALDSIATEDEIDMASAGTYDIDCYKKCTGDTQAIATRGPTGSGSGFTVSEAGTPAANADYIETGISGGKAYYKVAGAEKYIYYLSDFGFWAIGTYLASDGSFWYKKVSQAETPLGLTNWDVQEGEAPSPVISALVSGDDSTAGAADIEIKYSL